MRHTQTERYRKAAGLNFIRSKLPLRNRSENEETLGTTCLARTTKNSEAKSECALTAQRPKMRIPLIGCHGYRNIRYAAGHNLCGVLRNFNSGPQASDDH